MRVDAGYSYANAFASKPTESSAGADFSKVMQEAKSTSKSEQVANVDHASEPASNAPNFRSMTVADLRDWVNNELDQGRMTLDESSAFIGLGLVIPNGNEESNHYALNVEKRNFISSAQGHIEYAKFINDPVYEGKFQTALDIMNRSQPQQRISESV